MGKLIVIEGTDCSGKQTQSDILKGKLEDSGYKVAKLSFPMYDTPTGKIIGGPYLGKESICKGWFSEGANNVPAKVASLYYAADRLYNADVIKENLQNNDIVILDRYIYSNMAHQAGKIKDKDERHKMFKWIENLEFDLLDLPKPDIKIFLHMPYDFSKKLQKNRKELDQLETSEENIINAEKTYLEMCDLYNFIKIKCIKNNILKNIDEISEELYLIIKELL